MMALRNADHMRRIVGLPRVLWIHRPIYVHGRRDEPGEPCPCCGSKLAEIVEEIEHLDVLIDRVTGERIALHECHDEEMVAEFWRLAESAHKLDMAIRCSRQQLKPVVDKYTKIITIFGGNRGGKTTIAAEWLVDQWVLRGGKGAKFWWVAPTRELTRVGVKKLVEGETTDRYVKPLIPPELVKYWPPNEQSKDQRILLIDGSEIPLKYAGRGGGNLKGSNAIAIVLDEGSEVAHEINWSILIARTTDARGQLMCPTTPVAGHWLQKYDSGQDYDEIAELGTKRRAHLKAKLICFDNPWISKEELELNIEASGGHDDPKVRREYYGEWVAEGRLLWRQFDATKHVVEYTRRGTIPAGYIDITNKVGQDLFYGHTNSSKIKELCGMDFNLYPMSVAVTRFLCAKDADQTNPLNWVIYIEDEVLKRCNGIDDFADWFANQAGSWKGRGLRASHFAGAHIICDGTGFFRNGLPGATKANAHGFRMRDHGFVCKAPRYKNNNPCNPPRTERIAFFNELLWGRRILINGGRCPELIQSLKTEVDDGTGDTLKRSGTHADRISGITDAASYLAYAALYSAQAMQRAA